MDLPALRRDFKEVLKASGLTQIEFSVKHRLSYSWINKFLNEQALNPRLNSLQKIEKVIERERRKAAPAQIA